MKHFHLYGAVERPILINNAKFNAQASGTIDSPPISRCTPLVRWALFVVGLLLSLLALCVVVSPSSTTVRTDQSASYNVETKGLKAGNGYNSKLKGRVSRVSSSNSIPVATSGAGSVTCVHVSRWRRVKPFRMFQNMVFRIISYAHKNAGV